MPDSDFINKLISHADETVDFFSSRRKAERERLTCAGFLRCLGETFESQEIRSPENDPPDVLFRSSNFEILMITDKERLHGDWKQRVKEYKASKTLPDLARPYQSPTATSVGDVYELVDSNIGRKAARYGHKTCQGLDVLVYINLKNRFLWPLESSDIPKSLVSQPWRSVSFIFPPYSHVVSAREDAPAFLRNSVGRFKHECENPDQIFSEL